jgi:hypothetical protein
MFFACSSSVPPYCSGNLNPDHACSFWSPLMIGPEAPIVVPGGELVHGQPVQSSMIQYRSYQRWIQAGFQDREITAWLWALGTPGQLPQLGGIDPNAIDPASAADWRAAGFEPTTANEWTSKFRNIKPEEAKQLSSAGWSPTDVNSIADSLRWARNGVTGNAASSCQSSRFTDLEAAAWNASGFDCIEAAPWRDEGITADAASDLKKQGIRPDQAKDFNALLSAGYSREEALHYAKNNIGPDGVKEFNQRARTQEEYNRLIKTKCRGNVRSEMQIVRANPYRTNGQCYEMLAYVVQWLGPDRAIMNIDFSGTSYGLIAVDFPSPPSSKILKVLTIGEGAFSYTSTSGAFMTVPRVRVLGTSAAGAF